MGNSGPISMDSWRVMFFFRSFPNTKAILLLKLIWLWLYLLF
jgi:hypothetical protein